MRTASPLLIDRDQAALVVIDIQERLAEAMGHRADVVAATARLIRACRILGIPVIVTRQYPQGLGDTVSELGEALEGIEPVDKIAFCCACEPAFLRALEAAARPQVVLCGMETHICVTQTALDLVARGMQVHVAADAVCSRQDRDRDIALDRMRAVGVTITTTEAVMYEALGQAGTPEFKSVLAMVKDADAGS
jgi:nicotinamidase-related amidase